MINVKTEWWQVVEAWAGIPGYEGHYEISTFGRVRRLSRARGTSAGRILAERPAARGRYLRVGLSVNGEVKDFLVHRLVALTFLGPAPPDTEVDHIDGNTWNNRLDNIRWLNIATNRAQGNIRRYSADKREN